MTREQKARRADALPVAGLSLAARNELLASVRTFVLPVMEKRAPIRAWIVDDTGIPTKGKLSDGVARQLRRAWHAGQLPDRRDALGRNRSCKVDSGLSPRGVAIVDGARKAYIFNKADSRGTWLSEGESILGWKVVSIDTLAARLQQAGRSLDLELFPRKK